MNHSIVPFGIHPTIEKLITYFHLKCFNMNQYIFDEVEQNFDYLQSLDPKEWRSQDHYSVLRIGKVRFHASSQLIKKAYRKQCLEHHPDKGRYRLSHNCKKSSNDTNNDYFSCITRANDLLSDPKLRRSFDSYDPEFNNDIPSLNDIKTDFYGVLGPAFVLNSRWSKKQPVPVLGDEKTSIDEVRMFYNFWDQFESWREWTYTTEPEDEGSNRLDRRWNDKQKKGERKQKQLEETRRINGLVELAKKNDPRLKQEEERWKLQKELDKKRKEDRKRQKIQEIEDARKAEEDRLRQEDDERKEYQKKVEAEIKKEKDLEKSKLKTERRRLRKLGESKEYFWEILKLDVNQKKSVEMRKADLMNNMEIICMKLTSTELNDLNNRLENCGDSECVKLLNAEVERLNKLAEEAAAQTNNDSINPQTKTLNPSQMCGTRPWNYELTQLLIKSINNNPPGTQSRWQVIADFMNRHITDLNVTEKQVISRAKSLKNNDNDVKKEAVSHQKDFTNQTAVVNGDVINKPKSLATVKPTDRCESTLDGILPWTAEEQKSLESALRKFGKDDPKRWDKISDAVGSRTKKDCILRYKELAEKLKKNKQNQ